MTKRVKYIAKGFLEDSGRLLNDFVEKNSVDFSDFAEIWRKHHFSLIYMGRPDEAELTEFTNEIFRVSSQFLSSASFYHRVGAVFLLYSLYQTQISDPEIKIRIEMSHWKIINSLRTDAIPKKQYSLLYIIDFLIENALVFVASQVLRGPTVGFTQKETKNLEAITNLKATYNSDILDFSADNPYQELKQLQSEYLEMKKQLGGDTKQNFVPPEILDELDGDLQDIVNPGSSTSKQASTSVGSRRAKIKAESFIRRTFDRFGQSNEGDEYSSRQRSITEDEMGSPEKRTRSRPKPRRPPKEDRKVGRPRKYNIEEVIPDESESEAEELDISHLFSQQEKLYLPPEETADSIKRKTKRDAYYKLSPKREEKSSSSSDID